AIYRVRALPLSQNSTYSMIVRDGNDAYDLQVGVMGKVAIKTNVGSFDTIITRLRIRDNSQFNKYDVKVYFSDDQRHVPVLIIVHHPAGNIRAEIAGSEFVATPAVPPAPGPTPTAIDPVTQPPVVVRNPPAGNGPPAGDGNSPDNAASLGELPFKVG